MREVVGQTRLKLVHAVVLLWLLARGRLRRVEGRVQDPGRLQTLNILFSPFIKGLREKLQLLSFCLKCDGIENRNLDLYTAPQLPYVGTSDIMSQERLHCIVEDKAVRGYLLLLSHSLGTSTMWVQ